MIGGGILTLNKICEWSVCKTIFTWFGGIQYIPSKGFCSFTFIYECLLFLTAVKKKRRSTATVIILFTHECWLLIHRDMSHHQLTPHSHMSAWLYHCRQEKQQIRCYSCHFSNLIGLSKGLTNCDTPFIADGVPTMTCNGACSTVRMTLEGEKGYLVVRNCISRCQDASEDDVHVECCHGDLCNGTR